MSHPVEGSPGPEGSQLVIGVAGGSGCGKTLFAKALAARLRPRTVALVSEDDYYRRLEATDADPSRFDFDAPSARDHARLAADLARLRQGLAIAAPVYSFRRHAPLKRTIPTPAAQVVIVEGLHVLNAREVRERLDFSIFLEVDADIRFIRRLLRDTRERGRSVKSVTDQYLATVKPAHERYVEPGKALADLVLCYSTAAGDDENLARWLDQALAALQPGGRSPLMAIRAEE